ncbi:Atg5p KNAG_0J01650 [Huiozyma naganishii CBS 8797]|uniref:Autophagy protein 5 n=1 Tax=Huiozyma naganishii (strain ATCC MYA-139 / BCRC 22969 / CBS 8797 / KCTC 17520 / NBRC 10181 / NCYC 3082 / Yp74L-3) TaxID=1071383 RepID=J7SAK3_HUIN7|nr:hypothetical protein KNAG_0J01650 [Kazachstania naganishii CBS 8797]CCK72246.1 hypothetical protein KNAG_0J01650 [Kazachstania naganishii CBS 8797]
MSIRELVWGGTINVTLTVDQKLFIPGVPAETGSLNFRIRRDSYIVECLPRLLNQLQRYMVGNLADILNHCWLECDSTVLPWFQPVGVQYDLVRYDAILQRDEFLKMASSVDAITVWRIKLNYGPTLPAGVIPLIRQPNQIESYWMHRWKQACFILNGTSKQMMSLSRNDSKKFWDSVRNGDSNDFEYVSAKIVPTKPRMIPLQLHDINDPSRIHQPRAECENSSGKKTSLLDAVATTLPQLLAEKGQLSSSTTLICQGIIIDADEQLERLYPPMKSFDGFLHVVVVTIL